MSFPTKLSTTLGLFSALAVCHLSAATITYSVSNAHEGGLSSISNTLLLPLFDPSSPDIPDNASLVGVHVSIHDTLHSFIHIYNNTGNELTFSGRQDVSVRFSNLASGLVLTDEESFPFEFSSTVGGFSGFFMEAVFDYADPNISAYMAGLGNTHVFLNKYALEGLYLTVAPEPGPSLNEFPNLVVLSELLGGSTKVDLTYTYTVPDTGATFAFMGITIPLLATFSFCRHRMSRRMPNLT